MTQQTQGPCLPIDLLGEVGRLLSGDCQGLYGKTEAQWRAYTIEFIENLGTTSQEAEEIVQHVEAQW